MYNIHITHKNNHKNKRIIISLIIKVIDKSIKNYICIFDFLTIDQKNWQAYPGMQNLLWIWIYLACIKSYVPVSAKYLSNFTDQL